MKQTKYTEQTFIDQSMEYFDRNYGGQDLHNIAPSPFLVDILKNKHIRMNNYSVLDIGCTPAANMNYLRNKYNCKCVRIEPNVKLVNKLKKIFPEFEFYCGTSDRLPFQDNSFDFVLLRSVLH